MDHAALMGVVHRIGDPPCQRQPEADLLGLRGGRPLGQILVQRVAPDQLHGEEVLAVLGTSRLVDGADVRVLQPGEGLRLALEHPDPGVVHERAAANDLDRHLSLRAGLLRLVDDPHAALAQHAQDPVLADPFRYLGGPLGPMPALVRTGPLVP